MTKICLRCSKHFSEKDPHASCVDCRPDTCTEADHCQLCQHLSADEFKALQSQYRKRASEQRRRASSASPLPTASPVQSLAPASASRPLPERPDSPASGLSYYADFPTVPANILQLIQQSVQDQLAVQSLASRKRSSDAASSLASPSPPKRTKSSEDILPLGADDVTECIYDLTSCPSPSNDLDPDEAARFTPEGQLLLPHHPSVRKTVANTNLALASVRPGMTLKSIASTSRRTPVHSSSIKLVAPDDDPDINRLLKNPNARNQAHDKDLKMIENHSRSSLPLASHLLWALQALTTSLEDPSRLDKQTIVQDQLSILREATQSAEKLAEISAHTIATTTLLRRNVALQDSSLPLESQSALLRTPWTSDTLFNNKLREQFDYHLTCINYEQSVPRLKSSQPVAFRTFSSVRRKQSKTAPPRPQQSARRQSRSYRRPSATVSKPPFRK